MLLRSVRLPLEEAPLRSVLEAFARHWHETCNAAHPPELTADAACLLLSWAFQKPS